jgi:hypothetical protein
VREVRRHSEQEWQAVFGQGVPTLRLQVTPPPVPDAAGTDLYPSERQFQSLLQRFYGDTE